MEKAVKLFVRTHDEKTLSIDDILLSESVETFRTKVMKLAGTQEFEHVLMFEHELLEDGRTLADYNV